MSTPQARGAPGNDAAPAGLAAVADLRRNYTLAGLAESELEASWWQQFARWYDEASAAGPAAGIAEPNAMVLGTVSAGGAPSARTVLLKGFSADGFVFYTNRRSRKGGELAAVPRASLLFPWLGLERQVVVAGSVEAVDDAVSDAYFASRPRGSQLGAWASPQSAEVAGRADLASWLAAVTARYDGVAVPRPSHWGGFLVVPDSVEFWQGRPDRMHDRLAYARSDGQWRVRRLAP